MAKDLNQISIENDQFVQEFLEDYKKVSGKDYDQSKKAGNNGYTPGQQFTLTGVVKRAYVNNADGKTTSVYLALETEEGVDLSLQSVMGLSSLKGYHTEGSFPNEYHLKTAQNDIVADQVAAEVVADFDFERSYKPVTREVLRFAAYAKENEIFKGKTATYLGTVVRPFVAKKAGNDISDSAKIVKAGYKRAQSAKLWEIL